MRERPNGRLSSARESWCYYFYTSILIQIELDIIVQNSRSLFRYDFVSKGILKSVMREIL